MKPIIVYRWLLQADQQEKAKQLADEVLANSVKTGDASALADVASSSAGPAAKKQKTDDYGTDDVVGSGGTSGKERRDIAGEENTKAKHGF